MPNPIQDYVDSLNRLLNRTITESRLTQLRVEGLPDHALITRRSSEGTALNLGQGRWLEFAQNANLADGAVTVTRAVYQYSDRGGWHFRYEYDRPPKAGKPQCHLHVNGRHPITQELQNDIHFPAGRISVEHLIWLLVQEYSVSCQISTPELQSLLADSYREWMQVRTDLADPSFP